MVPSLKVPVDPWWHVGRANEALIYSIRIFPRPIYLDTALLLLFQSWSEILGEISLLMAAVGFLGDDGKCEAIWDVSVNDRHPWR